MNASLQPPRLTIAKPCSARWEDMSGDERTRFCGHCQKHVYNLSVLTTPQIQALITEREGKFCGRFYQRPDGTMLTADCPVGKERFHRRVKNWIATVTATVALFLGTLAAWASPQKGRDEKGQPVAAAKLGEVQAKRPVQPLMGDVCLPAPQTNVAKPHLLGEVDGSATNRSRAFMGRIAMPPRTNAPATNLPAVTGKISPPPATNAHATNPRPVMGLVCPPQTNTPPPAPPK